MNTEHKAALPDAEALARRFHETYERLAPSFGYETRTETRAFDPTTPNGRLMVAVCAALAGGAEPVAWVNGGTLRVLAEVRSGTIAATTFQCEGQDTPVYLAAPCVAPEAVRGLVAKFRDYAKRAKPAAPYDEWTPQQHFNAGIEHAALLLADDLEVTIRCEERALTAAPEGRDAKEQEAARLREQPADDSGHRWGADGERCEKCGDKDWMGGPCNAAAPASGEAQDEKWTAYIDGYMQGANDHTPERLSQTELRVVAEGSAIHDGYCKDAACDCQMTSVPADDAGKDAGVLRVAIHMEDAVRFIEHHYPNSPQLDRGPILRNMKRWAAKLRAALQSTDRQEPTP